MVNNIGEKITKLRKETMMSQESLAEKIGVSRQAISKWERDETLPDIQNLIALSNVFGVSVDDIINNTNVNNTNEKSNQLTKTDLKKKSETLTIIAVMMYIGSFFAFLILPFEEQMNIFVFGIIIAIATGIIIYAAFLNDRFKLLNSLDDNYRPIERQKQSYEKSDKDFENFNTAVSIITVIIYLVLGFVYGAWHPGWIVFLAIPALISIYSIFNDKKTTE